MTPSIFISIANYRDPETQKTIASIFDNAKYPDRITIGVHSQIDLQTDSQCLALPNSRVKQIITPHLESKGCCWARHRIMTELLGDEEFFLQIDSHSRFDLHWDELVLRVWEECKNPKAYLSHYPPGYKLDGTRSNRTYIWHQVKELMPNGIPKYRSGVKPLEHKPAKPVRTPFMAAGCFFIKADAIRQIPYDPYIYFEGEETAYATRLFTHGWDGYTPQEPFLYHLYFNKEDGRVRHFEDNKDYHKLNKSSFARVRHLLEIEQCNDPQYLVDFNKYSLGSYRTLAQYEHFAGLYFSQRKVTKRASDGDYENVK